MAKSTGKTDDKKDKTVKDKTKKSKTAKADTSKNKDKKPKDKKPEKDKSSAKTKNKLGDKLVQQALNKTENIGNTETVIEKATKKSSGRPKKVLEDGNKPEPKLEVTTSNTANVDLTKESEFYSPDNVHNTTETNDETANAKPQDEVVVETPEVVEEPKKEEVAVEVDKPFIPFPQTDLEVTTKKMVVEYEIDCPKLPIEVLDKINALNEVFTQFVQQPYNIALIPKIRELDDAATASLKEWVDKNAKPSNKDKYELPDGRVLVNNETSTDVMKTLPNVVYSGAPSLANQVPNQNIQTPVPNQPSVTMVSGNMPRVSPPPVFLESNPSNGQPYQHNQPKNHNEGLTWKPITDNAFMMTYSESIMEHIKATFQFNSWGYVPADVVQGILNGCDKSFKYELFQDGANSFVRITKESDGTTIETQKFKVG